MGKHIGFICYWLVAAAIVYELNSCTQAPTECNNRDLSCDGLALGLYTYFRPVDRIVFTSNSFGNREIMLATAFDNSRQFTLTRLTNDTVEAQHPALSPDGQTIVWAQGGVVTTMNLDGTGVRSLASGAVPRFTSDGRIVFERSSETFIMNADGAGEILLSTPGLNPHITPWPSLRDGTIITVTQAAGELFSMSANGGAQTQLTSDALFKLWPAVLFDGRIAYQQGGQFFAVNRDGSNPALFEAAGGNADSIAPSNVSDTVVYGAGSGAALNIFIKNPDGSTEQLFDLGGEERWPFFHQAIEYAALP